MEAKEAAVLSRVQGRVETEKPRSQKTGGKNIWSNEGETAKKKSAVTSGKKDEDERR